VKCFGMIRRRGERGLSETALHSFRIGRACAAPTGLGGSREYVPTASAVGYGVSSLAGLGGEAMSAATGVRGEMMDPASRLGGEAMRAASDVAVMR
jgi:hypothetical protein